MAEFPAMDTVLGSRGRPLPSALLFDVDGTLADTEGVGHRPAYNDAFAEFGLAWHWSAELYRSLLVVAGGRERLHYYLERDRPPLNGQAEAAARDPAAWVDAIHRSKTRHFEHRLAAGAVPLRPGVARLMREAAGQGCRLALVTNASRPSLDLMCRHLLPADLQQAIAVTACGDEVTDKKPAPDLYSLALEKLQLTAGECLAVEDAGSGLAAARAAGIACVVAYNDDTAEQDFALASLVVDHLGEPDQPFVRQRGADLPAGHLRFGDLAPLLR
ncbi:HAD-IA family hydrolase [Spectribacter hydrogenoxidans]|uniref:HAD-IA family hydrolase n=1 Tax=Spectribacter hydrogenoxidans TaxID=3075608 RepID=A0ABU3C1P1_9GAMM|nr:HAD-IA family hydrolase [Salinisphaera sp. W335]MDT0635469.1 HAD-IA family hydrolase [Salinisphaera sp. W335]